MMPRARYCPKGFTLIEIIITLVVAAILGTMIVTYFGTAFSESVTPITRLKASANLHRVMENITADYNQYPKWRSATTYTADTSYVIPTVYNGHYYKCTSGGKSGAVNAEPAWPTSSGDEVNDKEVTWKESGRLRAVLTLDKLKENVGNEGSDKENDYGQYHVLENRFIQFVNNGEVSDTTVKNILKVKLENETGESLTALFVSD